MTPKNQLVSDVHWHWLGALSTSFFVCDGSSSWFFFLGFQEQFKADQRAYEQKLARVSHSPFSFVRKTWVDRARWLGINIGFWGRNLSVHRCCKALTLLFNSSAAQNRCKWSNKKVINVFLEASGFRQNGEMLQGVRATVECIRLPLILNHQWAHEVVVESVGSCVLRQSQSRWPLINRPFAQWRHAAYRTPFPTVSGSNSMWTSRWIGR